MEEAMTLGIRTKLVGAFILVIVLPVAVIAGGMFYGISRMQESDSNEQLTRMQQINQIVVHGVTNGYGYLDKPDVFYRHVKPLLEKHKLEMQIEGLSGKVYFDSRQFFDPGKAESRSYWETLGNEASRSTIPIILNNEVVSNAVLTSFDPDITGFTSRIYYSMFISLVLGVVTLIILVVIFTFFISRSVLEPLKVLNEGAENIARGNLDHVITYRAADELGRFSQAFDQMRVRLKESLQKQHAVELSRKEMVASISHDLRTPIASIKGYVEGLQDGVATDRKMFERYLAVIKDKTDKLDRLIDELFNFAQLDLGMVEVNLKEDNSRELLEQVFSGYELELGAGVFNVERPLPSVQVMVDKHKIEQVVDNLVNNARRYAGENTKIFVSAHPRRENLVVEVHDNGPGIAEEDLPHVFERFYRGEKSRSRDLGGKGLGLAICQYIVEAHDGRIWVESTPGKGSIFYFSLPIKS